MHGSIPIRSTSVIVNTLASRRLSSSRSPLSSERTPTSASFPASIAGSFQPERVNPSPPSPSAAASTIPWTFPLGDDSGVFRSPWASIQITPPGPCAAAIPTSEPSATEWSPPRTSGVCPFRRAPATSFATTSQIARICGRNLARSSPPSVDSATGVTTFPRSTDAIPSVSRRCCSSSA